MSEERLERGLTRLFQKALAPTPAEREAAYARFTSAARQQEEAWLCYRDLMLRVGDAIQTASRSALASNYLAQIWRA